MKKEEVLKGAYDQWITKGYEHFSDLGPNQLSIRKISGDVQLPRTSFYYYFENQEEYLNELLSSHWDQVTDLFETINKRGIKTCAEFFRVLEQYPATVNFQNQLFKNREKPHYNKMFLKVYEELYDQIIYDLISQEYETELPNDSLKEIMLMTSEVWFSRLFSNNISAKVKMQNLKDIMKTVSIVIEKSAAAVA